MSENEKECPQEIVDIEISEYIVIEDEDGGVLLESRG